MSDKITSPTIKEAYLLICACFFFWSCGSSPSWTFELEAGSRSWRAAPLTIDLPEGWQKHEHFSLYSHESELYLPVQKVDSQQIVFLPDSPLPPETRRTYTLQPSPTASFPNSVQLTDEQGDIAIHIGDKPVLKYHVVMKMPPEGDSTYYKRNGFIHPLYSPAGTIITDDFPRHHHTHQHGMFLAWVKTKFQGRELDFWNQAKQLATVEHVEVVDTLSGPVFSRFTVNLRHMDLTQKPAIEVLKEQWTVTVYKQTDNFLIDLESNIQAAGDSALHVEEYHYGGMAIRGSGQWFDPEEEQDATRSINEFGPGRGGFLTSEGQTRGLGNHTRPHWVSMFGQVDEQAVGVAAMGHPSNFRFPQPVRIHPTMPYFCFMPGVLGGFDIGNESVYTSQYRFFVFDGEPDAEQLETVWQEYEAGPTVVRGPK